MTAEQYYLTMPGIPVLCHTVRILQNTGRHFPRQLVCSGIFLRTDPENKSSRIRLTTRDGDRICLVAGFNEYFVDCIEPPLFETSGRQEKLLIYTDTGNQKIEPEVNNSMMYAFIEAEREMRNRDTVVLPPAFLIFTEEPLTSGLLRNLKNIRFDFGGSDNENH